MATANMRFAKWLAETRTRAKMTQNELAEALGLSQATVHYWETLGKLAMEPDEVRRLARCLHVLPVEVAEALGYPTRPSSAPTHPLTPAEWEERIAALSLRLGQTVETWAMEWLPEEGEGHGRNDRRG